MFRIAALTRPPNLGRTSPIGTGRPRRLPEEEVPMRHTARAALRLAVLGIAASTALVPASSAHATAAPTMSVSPNSGLHDGDVVTVSGSNFAPKKTFYMVECSGLSQSECDIGHLVTGSTSAGGTFTTTFTVHTGAIGSGTCNTTSTNCTIDATTDPNPADTAAAATAPLAFGGTSGPAITVTPHTGVRNNQTVK